MAELKQETSVVNESKTDKFERLAEHRINNALKAIQLLGNLTSSQYEGTSDNWAMIISALSDAITGLQDKINHVPASKGRFTFKT